MFTKAYLKSLAERAVMVFVATLAGVLTADGFNWLEADWRQILLSALVTTASAVVLSVAGGSATSSAAPAMTSAETEHKLAHEATQV